MRAAPAGRGAAWQAGRAGARGCRMPPNHPAVERFVLDHPKFGDAELLGRGGFSFVTKAVSFPGGETALSLCLSLASGSLALPASNEPWPCLSLV